MYAMSRFIKLKFTYSGGGEKLRFNKIYAIDLRNIEVKLIDTKRELFGELKNLRYIKIYVLLSYVIHAHKICFKFNLLDFMIYSGHAKHSNYHISVKICACSTSEYHFIIQNISNGYISQ